MKRHPRQARRVEPRIPCHRVVVDLEAVGHHHLGILFDISVHGAFVCMDFHEHDFAPGSAADLVVLSHGSRAVTCHAHVAHLNATGIGLVFDRPAFDLASQVLAANGK
jgi:hypothetical protein